MKKRKFYCPLCNWEFWIHADREPAPLVSAIEAGRCPNCGSKRIEHRSPLIAEDQYTIADLYHKLAEVQRDAVAARHAFTVRVVELEKGVRELSHERRQLFVTVPRNLNVHDLIEGVHNRINEIRTHVYNRLDMLESAVFEPRRGHNARDESRGKPL